MGGQAYEMRRLTSADRIAIPAGLIASAAGVVVLIFGRGIIASTIGVGLLGTAGVAFVALVFLLVGEGGHHHYRRGAQ